MFNKRNVKRSATLLLSLCALGGVIYPAEQVIAEEAVQVESSRVGETVKIDQVTYRILSDVEGQRTVQFGTGTHSVSDLSGDVIIPSTVDIDGVTYTVTRIGENAFFDTHQVSSIFVPKTVTELGAKSLSSSGARTITFEEGIQINEIPDQAFQYSKISRIDIPASVEKIGKHAFSYSENLTNINFPENSLLKSIGESAFSNMDKLSNINLPAQVNEISGNPFVNSKSLKHISVNPANPYLSDHEGVLYNKEMTHLYAYPPAKESKSYTAATQLQSIGDNAFAYSHTLSELTLNEGLKSIGVFSFRDTKLQTIHLPKSLNQVGRSAFQNSQSITQLSFPYDCEENFVFDRYALYGLDRMISVHFGSGIKNFPANLLSGSLSSLQTIQIDAPNAEIVSNAFDLSSESDAEFKVTSESVANQLKEYGFGAEKISLLESEQPVVEEEQEEAPEETPKTENEEVEKPEEPEVPSDEQTSDPEADISHLGESFKVDGMSFKIIADEGDDRQAQIGLGGILMAGNPKGKYVIPESVSYQGKDYLVTNIAEYAFFDTKELSEIFIPKSVKSIERHAFNSTSAKKVVFEEGSTISEIPLYAFAYSDIRSIDIPESVERIGNYAFSQAESLSSVNFSENSKLKEIGKGAFSYVSNLKEITLPKDLEVIHGNPFSGSQTLEAIQVHKDNVHLISLDGVLYSKDLSRLIAYPTAKSASEYVLPEGVKNIGEHAFEIVQKLEKLTLSEGVESIGTFAFKESKIKNIEFPSTLQAIGRSAFQGNELLEAVSIPYSGEAEFEMGRYAFYNLNRVESIHFGKGVQNFPSQVIAGVLSQLKTIQIDAPDISVENDSFKLDDMPKTAIFKVAHEKVKQQLIEAGIPAERIEVLSSGENVLSPEPDNGLAPKEDQNDHGDVDPEKNLDETGDTNTGEKASEADQPREKTDKESQMNKKPDTKEQSQNNKNSGEKQISKKTDPVKDQNNPVNPESKKSQSKGDQTPKKTANTKQSSAVKSQKDSQPAKDKKALGKDNKKSNKGQAKANEKKTKTLPKTGEKSKVIVYSLALILSAIGGLFLFKGQKES